MDGGAAGDIVSASFCRQHGIPSHNRTPIPIVLPNGSTSTTYKSATLSVNRGAYTGTVDAIVYDLDRIDLILGKPWLTRVNPRINWQTNTLVFEYRNQNIIWACRGYQSKSVTAKTKGLLLSHIHFAAEAAQSGASLFMVRVQNAPPPEPIAAEIPPDVPEDVRKILTEYRDVFPSDLPAGLPPSRGHDMRIETDPTADPPYKPIIRLSLAEQDELKRQIQSLLAKGFIKPSTSPFGAPVLFVRKKDGTMRMCVDYRALNRITKKNRHALPRVDELIDRLRGAQFFSKLDLMSGYHQMLIHPDDQHKTAFRSALGHYSFTVTPFGLANAPAEFSAMMRRCLAPVLEDGCLCFIDDLLVYGRTREEHNTNLQRVLSCLRQHRLYAKMSKCSFLQEKTEFLGHVISKEGVHTSGGHVKAIREWPKPSSQREVQQFLGLCQFYHQYIKNFADIAFPLTELTRSNVAFRWGPSHQHAFNTLKKAVTSAPVLRIFDPRLKTSVETDASGFAIGAVLFQTDAKGHSRPVAFASRKLSSAERNYATHEQELLAIVWALQKWRYYLDGSHFIVYTDHATLRHFPTQPKLTGRQARWMEALQEYDFTFRYKPGKDNIVPDALSRRPDHAKDTSDTSTGPPGHGALHLHSMSVQLDSAVKERLAKAQRQDKKLESIRTRCQNPGKTERYFIHDDLLWLRDKHGPRVCVPPDCDLVPEIFHDAHDAPISGHLGFDKTYDKLRRVYFWPRLARDLLAYIRSCPDCQRNKPSQQTTPGLYMPLPIPSHPWQTVSMDFIVRLPKTPRGFDAIAVFVDKLTKQVHFAPCHTNDTASDFARLFFHTVFKHHGMPEELVSDRDAKFTGTFWRELTRLMGTKLSMSTAYHPQSDGQTENTNKNLEQMLRAYVNLHQNDWDDLLPMMEFAVNDTKQASTGFSPFFLNYGRHPTVPACLLRVPESSVPSVEDFLANHAAVLEKAKESLRAAQERQRLYANKHRRLEKFQVGDMVLLNAKNLSIANINNRPSSKLETKFIGPFPVVAVVNDNAYKLKLPDHMRCHDTFNVDLLKRHIPPDPRFGEREPSAPAPVLVDGEEEWEVEKVLQHRYYKHHLQYFVKWRGFPIEEASWQPHRNLKNAKDLVQEYIDSHLNGQTPAPTDNAAISSPAPQATANLRRSPRTIRKAS